MRLNELLKQQIKNKIKIQKGEILLLKMPQTNQQGLHVIYGDNKKQQQDLQQIY